MQHKHFHKGFHKKYRRVVMAMAGAALLSSAMLPGISTVKAEQAPFTQAKYYTVDRSADAVYSTTVSDSNNPVDIVRDNAGTFGFNSSDHFSLLSKSGDNATVSVRSNGQTFKVDLARSGDNWVIKTIRGIGDMTHPATYRPASMYLYQGVTTAPTPTIGDQTILFQTSRFDDWNWYQKLYPAGLTMGVLLQNPTQVANTLPDTLAGKFNNIDFSRQMVLYTHLGNVADQGYGIGISRVTQTGNTLMVTVRTKSPQAGETRMDTKTDDFIVLDRSTLDLANVAHVIFADQNGTILANYTLTPR